MVDAEHKDVTFVILLVDRRSEEGLAGKRLVEGKSTAGKFRGELRDATARRRPRHLGKAVVVAVLDVPGTLRPNHRAEYAMASDEELEGLFERLDVNWTDQPKYQSFVIPGGALGVSDHAPDHVGLLERQWARCRAELVQAVHRA
jgi:hypothetical protein